MAAGKKFSVVDMLLNNLGGPLPIEFKGLAHPVSEPAKPAGTQPGEDMYGLKADAQKNSAKRNAQGDPPLKTPPKDY
jgi:hypothetical protein